jgi:hypothetical protein
VTIQDAIKACLTKKDNFGRPVAWKGTGTAIDLACRLDKARARKLISLNSPNNLLGSDWNPTPTEFLEDWEVVTADQLANECCEIEKLGL